MGIQFAPQYGLPILLESTAPGVAPRESRWPSGWLDRRMIVAIRPSRAGDTKLLLIKNMCLSVGLCPPERAIGLRGRGRRQNPRAKST
jgi:hypothetical protein